MSMQDDEQLPMMLGTCVAMLLMMTACVIRYLPQDYAMIIVSWALLSVSVGLSFGHCVLSEPLNGTLADPT